MRFAPITHDEYLDLGVRRRWLKKPDMLAQLRLFSCSQLDEMPLRRQRLHRKLWP